MNFRSVLHDHEVSLCSNSVNRLATAASIAGTLSWAINKDIPLEGGDELGGDPEDDTFKRFCKWSNLFETHGDYKIRMVWDGTELTEVTRDSNMLYRDFHAAYSPHQ